MIGYSVCLVFMVIFQSDASLNFSCHVFSYVLLDVQSHKNYPLLTSPAKCLPTKATPRIMGGTNARLGEFPWMAILILNNRNLKTKIIFCDGSIISSKYVLTAAHCLTEEVTKENLIIRVGENDLDKEKDCDRSKCSYATEYNTESYLNHPNYDDRDSVGLRNDIALVRVKGDIIFNEFVYPACLPTSCKTMEEYLVGKNATVAGWGHLADEPKVVVNHILQKVEMPVVELSLCNKWFNFTLKLSENQLCVGASKAVKPMKSACRGNSGGPIMYSSPLDAPPKGGQEYYVQFGIVSGGDICDPYTKKQPVGVYTKVASYLLWILDNISK